MKKRLKKGDHIYYYSQGGDTIPAIILEVGVKRVKIRGNFLEGDRIVYVKKSNCVFGGVLL
jgi:hypothetical protein